MVSVIIPVYNGAEFLEKCLRSVMQQTYQDIEIIVIDDGSKDNSYEICERLVKEDKRIRLFRQENAGVSAARNKGMSVAKGDYITFVDADDVLLSRGIETLLEAAGNDADLIIGSHEEFRGKHTRKVVWEKREYTYDSEKEKISEFDKLVIFPWGKLYKHAIITNNSLLFDPSLAFGEDHAFNFLYCKCAGKIKTCSEIVYQYRMGGMASSVKYYANKNQMALALLKAYGLFFDGLKNIPLNILKKIVRGGFLGSVEHYLTHCDFRTAIKKVNETLALFSPYLCENTVDGEMYSLKLTRSILQGDAKGVALQVYKENWIRILLRKAKKLYYKVFTKRI